jgi:hypothetical protein
VTVLTPDQCHEIAHNSIMEMISFYGVNWERIFWYADAATRSQHPSASADGIREALAVHGLHSTYGPLRNRNGDRPTHPIGSAHGK